MKIVILHDNMNPNQEVLVDADSIVTVTPFGSGAVIQTGQNVVAVHETPSQVMQVIKDE